MRSSSVQCALLARQGQEEEQPPTVCSWLMCPLISPNHPLLRHENAVPHFLNHQKEKGKRKKACSQMTVSLLKVTNVVVSSVLLWRASLYIWYVVSTKNHWHLERYQYKMNPSFLRGIYIKIKLFHPPIVSNTATHSFYSLGFLSIF